MGLYVAIPLVLFIIVLLWIVPVGLWLQAIFSIGGGHVTIFNLVGMRFRRVPPSVIVNGLIFHFIRIYLINPSHKLSPTNYLANVTF